MKMRILCLMLAVLFLTACGQLQENVAETTRSQTTVPNESDKAKEAVYVNITAQEAKQIMDTQSDYIILDVRSLEEFEEGHIPGAVLIPDTEVELRAEKELPRKDQLILVYCRSGRRSKLASEVLVKLGYTNIKEFGGIIDWPYEVEKD